MEVNILKNRRFTRKSHLHTHVYDAKPDKQDELDGRSEGSEQLTRTPDHKEKRVSI